MARWVTMSTADRVKYLEKRLEEIKTCQRLLSEFERLTASKLEALNEEPEENEK